MGMLDLVFICYFAVPLKGHLLYYFPHILSEYDTWIGNLDIFTLRFVPNKCGLQGHPAPFPPWSSWWIIRLLHIKEKLNFKQYGVVFLLQKLQLYNSISRNIWDFLYWPMLSLITLLNIFQISRIVYLINTWLVRDGTKTW